VSRSASRRTYSSASARTPCVESAVVTPRIVPDPERGRRVRRDRGLDTLDA
jgi:hypothetical protein